MVPCGDRVVLRCAEEWDSLCISLHMCVGKLLVYTLQDSLKKEEALKKELAMRLSVASFFIDTFQAMAEKRKRKGGDSSDQASATEVRLTN